MPDEPPPILSYAPPGRPGPLAWLLIHRRLILDLLIFSALLLFLAFYPCVEVITRTDLCALCGSNRVTTQESRLHIAGPPSTRIGLGTSGDPVIQFPPHRHIWIHQGTKWATGALLESPMEEAFGCSRIPGFRSCCALFILRSQDKDDLRPIERGQACFDILLDHDTPAARAILSAQPNEDVERLNTELSNPRWQTIIANYHQLPLPAQEPEAVGW